MKSIFVVEHVTEVPEVEQYGKAVYTHEEAMEIFAEAVHAYGLDDAWDGVSGVCEFERSMIELLVIREIQLPE